MKLSKALKGHKTSKETRKKISETKTGVKTGPQKIITCPYCGTSGGNATMPR
jgi:hypothetical protein